MPMRLQSRRFLYHAYITHFNSKNFIVPPLPLKKGARGLLHSGLSVCEWVCESVRPQNLVNTISKTNEGNFTKFWSQMYLG